MILTNIDDHLAKQSDAIERLSFEGNNDDTQNAAFNQKELFRTKRSYVPVEFDKRQRLIKAVEEEGLTIKEAAQNLKINYSTAKHIVKVYKRTGEVQTQMMNKRLPERDVRTLEAMTFQQIPMQWGNPFVGQSQFNPLALGNTQSVNPIPFQPNLSLQFANNPPQSIAYQQIGNSAAQLFPMYPNVNQFKRLKVMDNEQESLAQQKLYLQTAVGSSQGFSNLGSQIQMQHHQQAIVAGGAYSNIVPCPITYQQEKQNLNINLLNDNAKLNLLNLNQQKIIANQQIQFQHQLQGSQANLFPQNQVCEKTQNDNPAQQAYIPSSANQGLNGSHQLSSTATAIPPIQAIKPEARVPSSTSLQFNNINIQGQANSQLLQQLMIQSQIQQNQKNLQNLIALQNNQQLFISAQESQRSSLFEYAKQPPTQNSLANSLPNCQTFQQSAQLLNKDCSFQIGSKIQKQTAFRLTPAFGGLLQGGQVGGSSAALPLSQVAQQSQFATAAPNKVFSNSQRIIIGQQPITMPLNNSMTSLNNNNLYGLNQQNQSQGWITKNQQSNQSAPPLPINSTSEHTLQRPTLTNQLQ